MAHVTLLHCDDPMGLIWLERTSSHSCKWDQVHDCVHVLHQVFNLQEKTEHCYDYPLKCSTCNIWLRNKDALMKHITIPGYCVRFNKAYISLVGNMVHYSSIRFCIGTVFCTTLEPLETCQLATLSQMQRICETKAKYRIHEPLLCNHCFSFFVGPRCLVEHLEIVFRNPPALYPWQTTQRPFSSFGWYMTMSEDETRWVPWMNGLEIKLPILKWKLRLRHCQKSRYR